MKIMQRLLLVALFIPAGSLHASFSEWIGTIAALGFFVGGSYALHNQKSLYVYLLSQLPAELIPVKFPVEQLLNFFAYVQGVSATAVFSDFTDTVNTHAVLKDFLSTAKQQYPDDEVAHNNALLFLVSTYCIKGGVL